MLSAVSFISRSQSLFLRSLPAFYASSASLTAASYSVIVFSARLYSEIDFSSSIQAKALVTKKMSKSEFFIYVALFLVRLLLAYFTFMHGSLIYIVIFSLLVSLDKLVALFMKAIKFATILSDNEKPSSFSKIDKEFCDLMTKKYKKENEEVCNAFFVFLLRFVLVLFYNLSGSDSLCLAYGIFLSSIITNIQASFSGPNQEEKMQPYGFLWA